MDKGINKNNDMKNTDMKNNDDMKNHDNMKNNDNRQNNRDEIRLVAIDLDDTLVRDDNTVSLRTIQTIQAAQNKGIHVVIATGRMFQSTWPVAQTLELGDVPLIIYSGGAVQSAVKGTILYENPLPEDIRDTVLRLAKENQWYVQVYIDDVLLVEKRTERTERYEKSSGAKAVAIGTDLYKVEGRPLKILMIDDTEKLDYAAKIIKNVLGESVHVLRSKTNYLEIMAPGSSKGAALLAMTKKLNIGMEQVMAFGNSQNDVDMLEIAGISVAVANAEDNVKDIAHIICDANNDDGVAKTIETYVLK